MTGELIALVILGTLLVLAIIAFAVWAFIFWILMIIDCAKRKFKDDAEKIVWIIVIIFLHLIGALIYYFAVKYRKKR